MAKNLVIVESPAKAKTIEKFLGKDFQVESSYGHIADLPSKEIGIDIKNDFKPTYKVSSDKKELVKKLKALSSKADCVWLASDEDREGEAISWHLAEELQLKPEKTKRIVFHEITKKAIQKAIENPRGIDYNLVNAQQARRILDRLVGYELSPVLWKKVKRGLSAGRVQSVAVRLIVDKEREIQAFKTHDYFVVVAEFLTKDKKILKARLEDQLTNINDAEKFLTLSKESVFEVADLEKKPARKSPSAPFTTSTLQQEASRKLGFSVSRTMQVAQKLYESGHITYMRTDSVNLSEEALTEAKNEIIKCYGEKFSNRKSYVNKSKSAQEAHEAIRPTDITVHDLMADRDQTRLYELIWKRTIASQMSDAELEKTTIKVKANNHQKLFIAQGEVIKFEGFLKVYLEDNDEEADEQEGLLPATNINEKLSYKQLTATQKFSRPPSRYTEASLVKKLEELGIGRPSTYAPTISTIINRSYVEKGIFEGDKRAYQVLTLVDNNITKKGDSEITGSNKGKLVPTDIGMIVNDFLVKNFESILDFNFTANVEQDFDAIAEGQANWSEMINKFYTKFHPNVLDVEKNANRESGERILGKHPESGKTVLVRLGKYGPMAQIGDQEDENKQFAGLTNDQNINNISLEEVLELFKLPKILGEFEGETIEANNGRYGPYVKFGSAFISLEKGQNATDVTLQQAKELILNKRKQDAPIAIVDGLDVTKGTGRFGPFIKWNGMFINVSKKYDFDYLTKQDIESLIEDKLKKESEKVVREWPDLKITIEKARWGRHQIIKGKTKIELGKEVDVQKLTLDEVNKFLDSKKKK